MSTGELPDHDPFVKRNARPSSGPARFAAWLGRKPAEVPEPGGGT